MKERNFLLSIIILLLVGVAMFCLIKIYKPNQIQNQTLLTPEIIKQGVLNSDEFLLPEVVSKGSTQVALPPALKSLLITDATTTSIINAVYPDNKKGYIVEMDGMGYALRSIMGFYIKVGNSVDWKIKKASYNTGFGLISLENSTYQVQIETTQTAKVDYPVLIKIIEK